jgi:hypothetical protein
MYVPICAVSQEACANYIENLNFSVISNSRIVYVGSENCKKGYNYFSTLNDNISVYRGYVPYAFGTPGSISVDTSYGSKYSDYTFIFRPAIESYKNFVRIDTKTKLRFHFRAYYDYDNSPNTTVFYKQFTSTNKIHTISATIHLENLNISKTSVVQINPKSSNSFIFIIDSLTFFFSLIKLKDYIYKLYPDSYFASISNRDDNLNNILIKIIDYNSKTICFQNCNLNLNCNLLIIDFSIRKCFLFTEYFNISSQNYSLAQTKYYVKLK